MVKTTLNLILKNKMLIYIAEIKYRILKKLLYLRKIKILIFRKWSKLIKIIARFY